MAKIQYGSDHSVRSLGTKGEQRMASKVENVFAASRFVLPEQRELYLQIKEDEKYVERPSIDEDEFSEMCFRIYESTQYDYAVTVKWLVPSK
ncbi:YolD-like family protein [Brevibacillus choshinensis]|uniref:YolD-like family protein n=1 Tax=Brevibacillus choshinensis TaxID=54911 RepID=UPI0031B5BC22